jgi:hypothetical protein
MSKRCPYEHGTVCTFDVLKLSDCQRKLKCQPRTEGEESGPMDVEKQKRVVKAGGPNYYANLCEHPEDSE